MEHEKHQNSILINYKANLGVTVMDSIVRMRCKNAFSYVSLSCFGISIHGYFGERQMVIWLDSNSNLCAQILLVVVLYIFFLNG